MIRSQVSAVGRLGTIRRREPGRPGILLRGTYARRYHARRMGELLAVAALSMFASNIVVSKIGAGRIALNAGYLIAVSVNVLASALLLAIDMAVRHRVPTWDGLGVLLFMGAGLFATYLGRWFILESIARLGPAKASAFQVSSPLFTAAIAWVALGERIGAVAVLGIVTAIAGLMLVSLPGSTRKQG